jgi:hypothetical protein
MHAFSSVYIRHISSPSNILFSPILRHHATTVLRRHLTTTTTTRIIHHHRHLAPRPLSPLAHSRIYPISPHPHDHTQTQTRTMAIFSSIGGVLGYETLPEGVKSKSFYDLKANLPGKDKVYDFVSGHGRGRGCGRGRALRWTTGPRVCRMPTLWYCVVGPSDGGC